MKRMWAYSPLPATDLHTHSEFSRCSVDTSVQGNIATAELRGLRAIAITDHSSHVKKTGFRRYIETVRAAAYRADITVLTGLEVDIRPDGEPELGRSLLKKLDIVIGSLHKLPRRGVSLDGYRKTVLTALRKSWMNILAHPTYVNGREVHLPDYTIQEICDVAYENSIAVELNSHHRSPSDDFIKACVDRGVKLTPTSDAHRLRQIGVFDWHLEKLRRLDLLDKVVWLRVKDL
ncbi:hypothetical protein DRO57_02950 [Candidatus Bathyarchaeota archaeon]|nr:MAG: hypothetical protein DRO57_02950 [Candidatus Bathyarchaeota archaeon]